MRERILAEKPLRAPETEQQRETALPVQVPAPEKWVQEEEKLLNERKRWEAERAQERIGRVYPGLDLKRLVL